MPAMADEVVVVGGGLAGIATALAAADGGARVTLLEARPRLGGATFSFQREGLELDNGQHVYLRCCRAWTCRCWRRAGAWAGCAAATCQPRCTWPARSRATRT